MTEITDGAVGQALATHIQIPLNEIQTREDSFIVNPLFLKRCKWY
jgi:hypothetical protein